MTLWHWLEWSEQWPSSLFLCYIYKHAHLKCVGFEPFVRMNCTGNRVRCSTQHTCKCFYLKTRVSSLYSWRALVVLLPCKQWHVERHVFQGRVGGPGTSGFCSYRGALALVPPPSEPTRMREHARADSSRPQQRRAARSGCLWYHGGDWVVHGSKTMW